MGSGATPAGSCVRLSGFHWFQPSQAAVPIDHSDGGVGDLFLTWADQEAGGLHFDSSPAFVFAPSSFVSSSCIPVSSSVVPSSIPSSTSTAPAASPADLSNWPLFSPVPSTAAPSFSDTPPTTAPSTTPASLLSAISTPLLHLDSYPGSQQVQQQQQQQLPFPVQDDIDWSLFITMPPADPIMFPAGLGMSSHHHHSPSSSVGATLATSSATQSRTPPLSLSPGYSPETSPGPNGLDNGNSNADNTGGNNNNHLQFLSFLDLSSLASTPAPTSTAAAVTPSVTAPTTTATGAAKVAGLTLSGAGIHKKLGAGGARVKRTSPSNDEDDNDNDPDLLLKRQRNSLAARKYRQKKIDRISELEAEVGQLQGERDALRIQLARQEAETAALREMLLIRDRDREDDGGNAKRRKRKQ